MDKQSLPPISDSEWKVMELLWDQAPRTAQDIIDALLPDHDWSPKTIKTLIFRLVKKGVLTYEDQRREYSYRPLIAKSSYIQKEGESFLRRLFGGATAPMVAHFVQSQKISAKEVQEIRHILNEIDVEEK